MASSQNGWVANDKSCVASQLVPGTNVKLSVRKDAPGLLLLEVAAAFDRHVEDIDNAVGGLDDWGYAERPIRGGVETSNHASGTAIDLNAPKHPLGVRNTFTPQQVAKILEIIVVTGNVVRWGGTYDGRVDEMHFEINDGVTLEDCERALAAMRAYNGAPDVVSDVTKDKELNQDQENMLRLLAAQIVWGENNDPEHWQSWGWTTWPGGTNEKLTIVDYLRRNNVEVRQALISLSALHQKVDLLAKSGPAGVIDYQQLAAAMVDQMLARTGH